MINSAHHIGRGATLGAIIAFSSPDLPTHMSATQPTNRFALATRQLWSRCQHHAGTWRIPEG
jgi:hypothetical protein